MEAICSGPECTRPAHSKGLCQSHYGQQHRGQPLTVVKPISYGPCPVSSCEKSATIKGYCLSHYQMMYFFNLTAEQLEDLATRQVCDLCGKDRDKGFAIDHDHSCCPANGRSCGKCVRGVLCRFCNTAMSRVDNDKWLARALDYK